MNSCPFERCVCLRRAKPCNLCEDRLTFSENGKKVRLSLRSCEDAKAIVLDGCVFEDEELKCDGLFLYRSAANRKIACLVELKGAGDIPHAFKQLAHVKHNRSHYRDIIETFRADGPGRVHEKAVIITNGSLSKTKRERLEIDHNIRVAEIIHSEASSKIPDLREYFRI